MFCICPWHAFRGEIGSGHVSALLLLAASALRPNRWYPLTFFRQGKGLILSHHGFVSCGFEQRLMDIALYNGLEPFVLARWPQDQVVVGPAYHTFSLSVYPLSGSCSARFGRPTVGSVRVPCLIATGR